MKNKETKILVVIGTVVIALGALMAMVYKSGSGQAADESGANDRISNEQLLREGAHTKGPMTAKVRIVEFLDPECESCAAMHPHVKQLLKEFPQVALTVRYMPFHGNSVFAASLLEAAALEDKYWQLMEALFHYQSEWASHHDPKPEKAYDIAQQIGMDAEKLRKTVLEKKDEFAELIEKDRLAGMALGVRGTPTFFVNGKLLQSLGYDSLKEAIEEELKR